ncbi:MULTISPECIES: hypothetical protein [unclassified Flavobacterium]|uniref:hypothetical protein n=1 Tax=unclassified Flavobacterium TaxID=196869 RepID=UPI0025B8C37A|nr:MULTISPECIES: hypothetical protein [unclassified Flavobacterium]
MKTFIKNIVRFSLFIIFIAILLQTIISLKIRNESLNDIDNLEQTSNINADLVFLGSSRCWVHFDPSFFDKTFKIRSVNIGVNGHTEIAMAILRLKNYLSKNNPPKFAILSFDPLVNAGSEVDNSNFCDKDIYARYSFFPNRKNLSFVNYFKFNLSERYIPLYSIFKYKMLDDCLSITQKYNMNCNHIVDKKWDTIHNPITNSMKKNYSNKVQITTVNSLGELNNLCKKNNIKLLCIQTPVYKAIYDELAFKNTKVICKTLNISFIDINIKPFRNNIEYFYSPTHLNKYGVEQMNQLLKKDSTLITFFKH